MKKVIKIISSIIIVILLLLFPIFAPGGILALGGSTARCYVLMWIGYIGTLISSIICLFKYKMFPLVIVSALVFIVGTILDTNFWKNENSNLCRELRSNSACKENQNGFYCTNFRENGIDFATSKSICEN